MCKRNGLGGGVGLETLGELFINLHLGGVRTCLVAKVNQLCMQKFN